MYDIISHNNMCAGLNIYHKQYFAPTKCLTHFVLVIYKHFTVGCSEFMNDNFHVIPRFKNLCKTSENGN